jgi:hypothetical protein
MTLDPRQQIAKIIADYRAGQINAPDAAHVDRWVSQFPAAVRDPVLNELVHVFGNSYASANDVKKFVSAVVLNQKLAGADPAAFWRDVAFLRLQQVGNSQNDMLGMFDTVLRENCGLAIAQCGTKPNFFLYLDDGIFSGGRIKSDMLRWIATDAPQQAKVLIVVMALHRGGQFQASKAISEAATKAGKKLEFIWWRGIELEDRRAYMSDSDVLRPISIPPEAIAYVKSLKYPPVLRQQNNVGSLGWFSSGAAKNMIEQEFLKAGILVRQQCVNLPMQMRPLGSTLLETTGFGAMFVTHRNIANNTPLVLWAGDPWYPLFPRRTN